MQVLYPGRIGIWRCWEGGKPENLEKENPLVQGEDQQQTQPTYATGLALNQSCAVGWHRTRVTQFAS